MLVRRLQWGSSLALQLFAVRAFQSSTPWPALAHRLPAFFRVAKSLPSMTALSISTTADEVAAVSTTCAENPLLQSWSSQPYNLPPFKSIEPSHFEPALKLAMEDHIADLEAIASSSSNDFDSILGAYDRAGSLYSKVGKLFCLVLLYHI